jgi:hypothetical protein
VGELGDLLERVFDPQFSRVRARVRTTVQLEPRRRLVERSGGVTMSLSVDGDPDALPPTTSESEQLIWLHADGRYRVDHPGGGHVEYGDDGTRLILRPGQPAMRMERSTGSPPFDRTSLEPGPLVVDVSDLDPTDLDAVRHARIEQMRARQGFGVPDRRARYQPTGPPPDDEEGARVAVGALLALAGVHVPPPAG